MSDALLILLAAMGQAACEEAEIVTTSTVQRRIQAAADRHGLGIRVNVHDAGDVVLQHVPERSVQESHRLALTLPHVRVIDTYRDAWRGVITRAIAHQDAAPAAKGS